MKFRALKANEIDVFPKMVKENGCMVLLYKDARCDMNILDEEVEPLNWKREHRVVNNNLFCTVSIYDENKKEWINKEDVGVESFTEKVKGQASDSFKRACFNWGIGRELYTTPFIWIPLQGGETSEYKGKVQLDRKLKFSVSKITTVEGKITELEIVDQNNKQRFKWSNKKTNTNVSSTSKEKPQTNTQKPNSTTQKNVDSKCKDCGVDIPDNVKSYSLSKLGAPYCIKCQRNYKK